MTLRAVETDPTQQKSVDLYRFLNAFGEEHLGRLKTKPFEESTVRDNEGYQQRAHVIFDLMSTFEGVDELWVTEEVSGFIRQEIKNLADYHFRKRRWYHLWYYQRRLNALSARIKAQNR